MGSLVDLEVAVVEVYAQHTVYREVFDALKRQQHVRRQLGHASHWWWLTAMARAVPHPMTISKEEWLAKRGTIPRDVRRRSCVNSSQVLADIPSAVPELPGAYLVRESDLAQLKKALLSEGTSSCTTLTSEKSKKNRVGAHGMGGKELL